MFGSRHVTVLLGASYNDQFQNQAHSLSFRCYLWTLPRAEQVWKLILGVTKWLASGAIELLLSALRLVCRLPRLGKLSFLCITRNQR